MWTVGTIITWLGTLGFNDALDFDLKLVPGTLLIPDMPDRLGIVTPVSGPGVIMEGLGDVTGFQLRCRGKQRDPDDAQRIARICDNLIRFGAYPATVGDVQLVTVSRAGGPPDLLTGSPAATTERPEWVCNYLPTVMEAPL